LQICAAPDHFDEFAAPETEVDMGIVLEDGGVVSVCMFEGFVDIAFEDGGSYTLTIYGIEVFLDCVLFYD
jgi:hypothetical protein